MQIRTISMYKVTKRFTNVMLSQSICSICVLFTYNVVLISCTLCKQLNTHTHGALVRWQMLEDDNNMDGWREKGFESHSIQINTSECHVEDVIFM